MTLTYFTARSTWVSYAFEWVRLLKCHLKGKTCSKLANGQVIDYSEKKAIGLHLPLRASPIEALRNRWAACVSRQSFFATD